jgi:hypothetical protein
MLVLAGAGSAGARAVPPGPLAAQSVVVLPAGVLWWNKTSAVLVGRGGRMSTLAAVPSMGTAGLLEGQPLILASGDWVAIGVNGSTLVGLAPGPLHAVAADAPFVGDGCGGWRPDIALDASARMAVADGRLLLSGRSSCPSGSSRARQPVYVQDIRSGRWRVLRLLPAGPAPVLAASGELAAIGVQMPSARMRVQVIDLASGRTRAQFMAPDGYLAFAGPGRLLLTAPQNPNELPLHFATAPIFGGEGPYRAALYSTSGRHLRSLGAFTAAPMLSHGTLVDFQDGVLGAVDLRTGAVRPLVGFYPPGRSLYAFALGFPALALVQSTTPLAATPSCFNGGYGSTTGPYLTVLDLRHPPPYAPAPPGPPPIPFLPGCHGPPS